jgi:hypothetical protein
MFSPPPFNNLPQRGNMSVEKIACTLFAPSGATHFSAIAIQNAYLGIAPTAQKTVFIYSTDILLLKEQLFLGNLDISTR